jgi:hypothetical protein
VKDEGARHLLGQLSLLLNPAELNGPVEESLLLKPNNISDR